MYSKNYLHNTLLFFPLGFEGWQGDQSMLVCVVICFSDTTAFPVMSPLSISLPFSPRDWHGVHFSSIQSTRLAWCPFLFHPVHAIGTISISLQSRPDDWHGLHFSSIQPRPLAWSPFLFHPAQAIGMVSISLLPFSPHDWHGVHFSSSIHPTRLAMPIEGEKAERKMWIMW